ncbi:SpoIIE family protein phosphatase [Streptomyces sp. NPDC054794]
MAAVIGDVEGHNTAAAVVMGQLSSAVRSYALEGHDPSTVLYRANRLMIDLETDLFATCCCVWLDPDTGTAQVVSAGHPRPLIRTADGRYLAAAADVGVPLGVAPSPSYQAGILNMDPGTLLVLYTDGLSGVGVELADEQPDAYALLGRPGRIVVTSGMLRALPAEERAVLLAHEQAHLAHGHHHKRSRRDGLRAQPRPEAPARRARLRAETPG